jgi:hypothetical protein
VKRPSTRLELRTGRKLQNSSAEQKKKKEDLETRYGKGTPARVKIRQVGGDDGYQYNVFVDGRSIMRGLTRLSAMHERTRAMDDIARKEHLGKYLEDFQ